jgi:hypothetical protein
MLSSYFRLAAVSATVLAFAACSGAQNGSTPSAGSASNALSANATISGRQARPLPAGARRVISPSMRYDRKKALIFVTNFADSTVEIYDPKLNDPSPSGSITNGVDEPTGDCLDQSGTLYVVNEGNSIPEYKAGQTTPYQTITAGLDNPAFCAVDGSGNLWVTNIFSANVTEYPKGTTSPSTIITTGITFPIGIAFDRKGDMYVSNRSGGSGTNVQVYGPGATSPKLTITDGVTEPCGIAVDAKGTLYVTNLGDDTVPEYKAGQTSPYQTITQGLDYPAAASVDKKGTLFVSNYLGNSIVEYAPGSTSPSSNEITQDLSDPEGTAYSPPVLPKG